MTVLFGGTFDPVHNGHVGVVRKIISALSPDRILIMPAYVNPFKAQSWQCAASQQRYDMCCIAFAGLGEVSDMELKREDVSYTVDTLEELHRTCPDSYVLAVGSDSLRTLPLWHRAEDIVKLCEAMG
ncbi:MAG: nicotinate-nicotinamide nucleotide adenylyltransferase, partial [Oscillospiraceae bacterium]|nr:nicotinate-nicotinamide nucleotide adenylyltransferase [Oscillospiraceae bacterium]